MKESTDSDRIAERLQDMETTLGGYKKVVQDQQETIRGLKEELSGIDELKQVLEGVLTMFIKISPPDAETLSRMAEKLKK